MTVQVVDLLKNIDIADDHCKGLFAALINVQELFKRAAVQRIGQRIVLGLMADKLLRLLIFAVDLIVGQRQLLQLGSAHHLYGKNTGKYYEIDFRPQDLWDCINDDFDADPLAAVEAYFAEVEKVAALKPDILAHIDLIKKLNAKGEFFDEESPRYKAAALKALQAAKDNDCLLEVNTGGVYRGYRKDFYPGPWLLGEWQKMGGKVIITSDSHDIASLTYGFDEAAAAIKAAGFTSVEVLTGHGFETQEL